MTIALLLLAMNIAAGLLRDVDDVGFYTNLGAQRLRERGMFPYGDPLLTNTPGATYSPILYYSHLIYQVLLAPIPLNAPDRAPGLRGLRAAARARQQTRHHDLSPDGRRRALRCGKTLDGIAIGVGCRGVVLRKCAT